MGAKGGGEGGGGAWLGGGSLVAGQAPLIIMKFPSSDFLDHLLIVGTIHLTFSRPGLEELLNFSYSWITCTEALRTGSLFLSHCIWVI